MLERKKSPLKILDISYEVIDTELFGKYVVNVDLTWDTYYLYVDIELTQAGKEMEMNSGTVFLDGNNHICVSGEHLEHTFEYDYGFRVMYNLGLEER